MRIAEVRRWITHADALNLLKAPLLANGEISRTRAGDAAKHIEPLLPRPLRDDLLLLCRAFDSLQTQRHDADYDDRYDVSRRLAIDSVALAEEALAALWRLQPARDPGTILLLRLGAGGVKIAKSRSGQRA